MNPKKRMEQEDTEMDEMSNMSLVKRYLLHELPKLNDKQVRDMLNVLRKGYEAELEEKKNIKTNTGIILPPSVEQKKRMLKTTASDETSKKWLQYVEQLEKLQKLQSQISGSDREIYQKLKQQCEEHFLPESFAGEILPIIMNYGKDSEKDGPLVMILSGTPGCGKTTAGKLLAGIMGIPYYLISAPGVDHGHGIVGEGSSYTSPDLGEIVRGMLTTQCLNPMFIIDEIEKAPKTITHASVSDELLSICDGSADHFTDNFLGFPIDIRSCGIIMTANDPNLIPEPLKDRAIHIAFPDVDEIRMEAIMERYAKQQKTRYPSYIEMDAEVMKNAVHILYGMGVSSIRQHQKMLDGVFRQAYQKFLMKEKDCVISIDKEMFDKQIGQIMSGRKKSIGFN